MTKYQYSRTARRGIPAFGRGVEDAAIVFPLPRSIGELIDDARLKKALQRAVRAEKAPQHLLDSIHEFIRR